MPGVLVLLCSLTPAAVPSGGDPSGVDFFERRIRPVFVDRCLRCHGSRQDGDASAHAPKGGLALDSPEAWLRGGARGPAVVPGDPAASWLLRALRYDDDDLRMPPKEPLPHAVVDDFERWIAAGAPAPASPPAASASAGADSRALGGDHWAFAPVVRPEPPELADPTWCAGPIDRFVLARLERAGLRPSREADRRTLIRRLSFDLTGLPPSAGEVAAFVADDEPSASEKLVDRLLASPAYAERQARHWLDVARYADTKDQVLVFGKDAVRPYAYAYRDYVIRAFLADTPFDRFVVEQLAADRVVPDDDDERWRLAAMGLLTLGRLFDNNPPDILDDRIDTVTRGFLGLTVACARCHDHKYDPISQADYYALYGVFASSIEPIDRPLAAPKPASAAYDEFARKEAEALAKLRDHIEREHEKIVAELRARIGEYLVAVTEDPDPLESAVFYLSLSPGQLHPSVVARWRRLVADRARPGDPGFGLWHELMELPEAELAAQAPAVLAVRSGNAEAAVHPLVREAFAGATIRSPADVARLYGSVLTRVATSGDRSADDAELRALVEGPESPLHVAKEQTYLYMTRVPRGTYDGLRQAIDRLAVDVSEAPPRAMVLVDAAEVQEPRIFVRGDPTRPGARVARRFLTVLGGRDDRPFESGSGRLDLAHAITAADNPLTARVIVDRVWMHLLGEPLVATPSDFGARSEPPTHPALLDYLAASFVADGWSLRRIHREIALSNAYRQSSDDRPQARAVDPRNRLLWRARRRRLELEPMRDAMLFASGRLDRRLFGPAVELGTGAANGRRTIYGLVDRQQLPGFYRIFDFASPDQSTAVRSRTTVPQQALFAMNSSFALAQATALAASSAVVAAATDHDAVVALYQRVLARPPTAGELVAASEFLAASAASPDPGSVHARALLAQVLLMSNEFLFVD